MLRILLSLFFFFISISCGFAITPSFIDLHGHTLNTASLYGKWLVINYWAPWCTPCLKEIKELNQFYTKNKGSVALFGVNFDNSSVSKQQQLEKQYAIGYPSLKQDPGPMLGLSPVQVVPVTFVINPHGQLVHTLYGEQTVASLEKALH